ncbi:MAG: hypothetical protein HN719_04975, partial [Alphaproteobacteria bacterium]|nr:hypothetical protein [Alphaproteobacteria bacterium]
MASDAGTGAGGGGGCMAGGNCGGDANGSDDAGEDAEEGVLPKGVGAMGRGAWDGAPLPCDGGGVHRVPYSLAKG